MDAAGDIPQVDAGRGSFWRHRVVAPVAAQLRNGVTPEKISLTVALGVTLGIFPILGSTTLLCAGVAFMLRLNQPVIHLVSYLSYPLQFALLLVFYRAGESLFGQEHASLSISMLMERFRASPGQFMRDFGMIGLQGVAVWSIVAPALTASIYFILRPPLRALSRRSNRTVK